MDAAAWFLQNAATVNRMETLSDSLLDAAVKRSVEMQEQYLDRACLPSASRRSSVSSLDSISSDLEDDDSAPPLPLPSTSSVNGVKISPESSKTEHGKLNHQGRRLRQFHPHGTNRKSRMEGKRSAASFENAITASREFNDLKTSMKPKFERRVYRHEELELLGIRTVRWDGRNAVPILTPSGIVLALLSGRPADPDWDVRMESLAHEMDRAKREIGLDDRETIHRRGGYPCVSTGLSLGGGSTKPGELRLGNAATKRAVHALRSHQSLASLFGYVKTAMSLYAKTLVTFCQKALDAVEMQNPSLARPHPGSPFGSLTFNFGPDVRTFPHKDFKNLSWGWCSITSLGSYDHTRGGHLVLWDLGIAVEFPPNATIFIPSAIIEHSNTEIQEGEVRQSITQYTSAGLFRWCAYGFQLKSTAVKMGIPPANWWSNPRHMFPRAPSE